ncbi:MAG: tRNA (5-methylaminomethyl-2-thiouridine)(34)-methyltransferase MnmD [Flavobacteriales bacterium]|nr:tRNA (5-methylaminomethyl-2-thiouridine)(34)-methyltransferase MnmD [Flavobacteriales bacterium]
MVKPTLYKTKDGSNTLYVERLDEHYHSVHGAVQESQHIFIEQGLKQVLLNNSTPSILEIGFGTGLNCLLTFRNTSGVSYTGIEKYPVSTEQALKLEYAIDEAELKIVQQIHEINFNKRLIFSGNSLLKLNNDVITFEFEKEEYDLIYFDAFSPESQPELWVETIFKKMYSALKAGGILVTYCAKGVVKRRLKSVGFTIENPPGPPGKREITRATK